MAEQMDKTGILDEMRTKYAALEEILTPLDETLMTTAGVNGDYEQFYKENKSRSLDDVLADFRTTYLQIVDVVQMLDNEDLIDADRFAWTKGNPLWYLVAGDTYEHYLEHSQPIKVWLAKSK